MRVRVSTRVRVLGLALQQQGKGVRVGTRVRVLGLVPAACLSDRAECGRALGIGFVAVCAERGVNSLCRPGERGVPPREGTAAPLPACG